ncbi:hypothetical protein A3D00_04100 [Candidatus Woesebacteria bacterium RIFCSPHIGHO2_02_FULL_38_9]|nr:MAG: hypothetical protein A3D00_04100 [Candidatus Woesebacteria bacterium RIFCSPHIGHO2_02_FULL_38_9]OGM57902.1 MAG: hypothetical protein A3A50_04685 [Candidatus Woesebacteria bacterium RIFCSPLOWO2_01_FULL_38_20]
MKHTKLPESFRGYFWDVDFDSLDKNKHSFLVIKRVLDRGKTQDIRWLLDNYSKTKIKKVILTTKDLSRATGIFWANIFNLDYKDLLCLQKPYSPIRFGLYS